MRLEPTTSGFIVLDAPTELMWLHIGDGWKGWLYTLESVGIFWRHDDTILRSCLISPLLYVSINFAKFCTKNEDIAKINFSESASLRFFCLPLRQKPSLSQFCWQHEQPGVQLFTELSWVAKASAEHLATALPEQRNLPKNQNGGQLNFKAFILLFCAEFGKIDTCI